MSVEIKFLGTGAASGQTLYNNSPVCSSLDPRDRRAESGILIKSGGERLLFDCGRGVSDRAEEFEYRPPQDPFEPIKAIVVSHQHLDHWGGVEQFAQAYRRWQQRQDIEPQPMTVFTHEATWVQGIELTFGRLTKTSRGGTRPGCLRFEPIVSGTRYRFGSMSFEPINVTHDSLGANQHLEGCLAFLIECENGDQTTRIFYTGDITSLSLWDWKKAFESVRHIDLDLLICEANDWDPNPKSGHCSVLEALEIFDWCRPKRGVLTHIAPKWTHQQLELDLSLEVANRKTPCPVEIAYDGLTIDV